MRFNINRSTGRADSDETRKSEVPGVKILDRSHYHRIEAELEYSFSSLDLLERAFTHRSLGTDGTLNDYERLEFLGDAVLDLAVAHLLLEHYPQAREGELSKMRAALVNTTSLAEVARSIGLGKFVKLSRGELASGGADRPSILADVLEAVMGAIYRDAGYVAAFNSARKLFSAAVTTVNPTDPKTELQEALHAAGSEPPVYLLECVEGPEHAPIFISIVEVDGQIVGRGRGTTKKASQQTAASEALKLLRNRDSIDTFFAGTTSEVDESTSTSGS